MIPVVEFVTATSIEGVMIVAPRRHYDARGHFTETWNPRSLRQAGIDAVFVQDNHSYSAQPGTVRGLHYQRPPHAQAKLVRCGRGRLLDVAVDIRCGSPTYGRSVTVELSAENGLQLFIPAGFLHGFMTLEPDCELLYKCSDYYAPDCDGAVRWDSCGIDWPLDGLPAPSLSDKDAAATPFDQFDSPFIYEAA
ncbi:MULTISPECIES: dTDP-4-dehydrorhamnose 3,5-epimerase [unclassified Novosphingobium]|uniref:dTDP-4-dehydrorhamnose 3,5-epimerase n=1 Tax=unclassified Novosphingobium TaxID=2644732 RepID=UPI00086E7A4D|nr:MULTISPECIES: dTDP-4-dehydrorhamnose 3,5-epimerase [unclassified Novosphingobium]MBN9145398.1 dTDP-4-dehydrorhamnose 3,5-epimerase [Novosphingobium sp.]MDR6709861.1 dTDP-4-dehydrorhamnose 3,5-epimerase [Novosphingobium sp. 1748]ODU83138.1 MAG: dTDP-4-dehydrorhamnose 3,5-epimerase [Novosphingobium sp. SCN 63-17]OJX88120.1 MAG: dTDP-4-dehydrorhamnose 3,5-epimerase [Novosphingobium sp. 63-713]